VLSGAHWWCDWVATGAAWVGALGVVVPTALLARLVRISVAAGVQPERGEKGQEGDCSRLRSLARNVCKYSSSTRVNLLCRGHQRAIPCDQLGSGNGQRVAGRWVRVTGYGSLNVEVRCICDGVHGVSNPQVNIRLNGSMKVLGAPRWRCDWILWGEAPSWMVRRGWTMMRANPSKICECSPIGTNGD